MEKATAVLTRMQQESQEKKAAAKQHLQRIAYKMATNVDVPEAEVQKAMADSGESFEFVRQAVSECHDHFKIVTELQKLEAEYAEKKDVSAEMKSAEQEFLQIQKEFRENLQKLQAEASKYDKLRQRISELQNQAKEKANPARRAEYVEAREQHKSLCQNMNKLREDAARVRGSLWVAHSHTEYAVAALLPKAITHDLAVLRKYDFSRVSASAKFADLQAAMDRQEKAEASLADALKKFEDAKTKADQQATVVREVVKSFLECPV